MKRSLRLGFLALAALIVAGLLLVPWDAVFLHFQSRPAQTPYEISSDPTLLYVELPSDDERTQVVWMLHPENSPSTFYETEFGDRLTRYTGAIVERTSAAYRVSFQLLVTQSGVTNPPQQQDVLFPFG